MSIANNFVLSAGQDYTTDYQLGLMATPIWQLDIAARNFKQYPFMGMVSYFNATNTKSGKGVGLPTFSRTINYAYRGDPTLTPQVQSVSLSASNTLATITLVDTMFGFWDIGSLLYCPETNVTARVVAKTPGTLVAVFEGDQTKTQTAFTANDFAAGSKIVGGGQGYNTQSAMLGAVPQKPTQTQLKQYIASTQSSFELTIDEMNYRLFTDRNQAGNNRLVDNIMNAKRNLWQQMSYKMLMGVSKPGPEYYEYDGVITTIKSQGGIYRTYSNSASASFMMGILRDVISEFSKNQQATDELYIFAGKDFLKRFQEAQAPYIQYAGKNNTIGGQTVAGINVMEYAISGVTVKIVDNNELDNLSMFPVDRTTGKNYMSGSAILLPMTTTETTTGSTMPFLQLFNFIADAAKEDIGGMTVNDSLGMYDVNGNRIPNSQSNFNGAKGVFVASQGMICNDPTRMAFIQQTA